MAGLEFDVVDVFTDRTFTGNPLAVVHGAEALSTRQLQAVAREFNLSETAFPMAPTPEEAARGVAYYLRIFTTSRELAFAGHPSVGAAWVMAARGRVPRGVIVQACGAGDLPLRISSDGQSVTLTGGTPTLGELLDSAEMASRVGLGPDDLAGPQAQMAGTGAEFCYLHVHPSAVPRAVPLSARGGDDVAVYVVGWPGMFGWPRQDSDGLASHPPAEVVPNPVRARFFAGDIGVVEDPATGSAALGLAVQAVACGLLRGEGTSRFEIVQGVEMRRPSRLRVQVDAVDGRAVETRVSGHVVPVSSGTIAVPR